MAGEGIGWCAARGRMGGRAPTRGGHVGEEECGGRWEWRTVMGWRGVECGVGRFHAEPRDGTWGRGGKMGPRMREDKGGVFTPILTFPPQGGRHVGEGGRPRGDGHVGEEECGGWREWRTVMGWRGVERGAVRFRGSARNGTWGRGGKMGPRMREDKGGVFTPVLTFPPQGGREGKEGTHEGRPYGGRGSGVGGVSGRRRSLRALRLRLGGWCRRLGRRRGRL